MFKIPDPLPCPGCGATYDPKGDEPGLRTGRGCVTVSIPLFCVTVRCFRCRLEMAEDWVNRRVPRRSKLRGQSRFNWQRESAAKVVLERWNRLPRITTTGVGRVR